MKILPLSPEDVTFQYQGIPCSMTNFSKNAFTKLWTFDLSWGDNVIRGVPISGGTSVVKGNGTIFNKIIFTDITQTTGDIVSMPNTKMFIVE